MHRGHQIAFAGIAVILSKKYIKFKFQQKSYYSNHEN